jgi:prephenate dehydrogenase
VSEQKPRVTIVGLGLIGGSIGLALQDASVVSAIVGHDHNVNVGNQAKKLGAVDRVHWNLISACEKADLIILAMPLGAIRETLEIIGPEVRPGCVIMDTASLKAEVLAWAAELLPDKVHYVGTNPILVRAVEGPGGLESARADLFRDGLFCLVPSPEVDDAAVKVATDLVAILGAKPLFFDAVEHDGLLAGVEHLSSILALGLLETVVLQPSWRESRKVAGVTFERNTYLPSSEPAALADLSVANRENVLRWLDAFSASLASIRQALAEEQSEALALRFQEVLEARDKWLEERTVAYWDDGLTQEMPPRPGLLDTFLGGLWGRRPKTDK